MIDCNCRHGFAAEPHKSWLYSPAYEKNGVVTCVDSAGFRGSWKMKDDGVFFPSETNEVYDEDACRKARDYCNKMQSA